MRRSTSLSAGGFTRLNVGIVKTGILNIKSIVPNVEQKTPTRLIRAGAVRQKLNYAAVA